MPSYLSPGVYVEEVSSGNKPIEGVSTAVCAFVGLAAKGPFHEPVLVTNWTQFTQTFGDFIEGSYLAHSVYGYFLNGGGSAYVVRIGGDSASANGSGDGKVKALPAARAALPSGADGGRPAFEIEAAEPGESGDSIAVEVQDASEPGEDNFKLLVKKDGKVVETFDNVTVRKGQSNVYTAVKQRSKLIRLVDPKGAQLAVPAKGREISLAGGSAPVADQIDEITADEYVGSAADRTGFAGLEAVEDVTMLVVPDLMAAYQQGAIDDEGLRAVQLAMIAHCELMGDRVAILDAPPGLKAQQLKDWRMNTAGYDSKYAALYWPWIKVMDPQAGRAVHMPPSGHMAGIWARNDDTRGVHKAPANEVIRGALAVEFNITRGEQDQLNPVGVNCIRPFPGQGIRVWGARTLSSDAEWRYLNVRRLFNFVEKSVLASTNWAVFEPNEPTLWNAVRRNLSAFLTRVWRSGALFGGSPNEAFFVKCDAENNPPENRDAGILTIDIGLAPVKPAEFVVFRLSQLADGASLSE
ncbi:phage tail sheath subtilisin-like domain-containing protein [Lentzea sp. NPDC051208]|uniref:phage tail sheath family protein n=1 Tax=Lentzea sp. NPDC051208 TaxID=3154642 RepID=UPI0034424985